MAFDFLGTPTDEQLSEFEAFYKKELDKFEKRSLVISSEINRLKILRSRLVLDAEQRGVPVPEDVDGGRDYVDIRQSEITLYDAESAFKMSEFKEPFVDPIRSQYEESQEYIRRLYFSITKLTEELLVLQGDKDELESKYTAAVAIINDAKARKPKNPV